MSKILVVYFSRTGNTKSVAEAIFGAIQGDKYIASIDEEVHPADYDLVFIGFPVHTHGVPFPVEALLKKVPAGKKIALFSTHGSVTGSRLSREAIEHASVIASKAKIIGTFSCRGKVSLAALEALMKSPEHEAWTDMAASAATHPDAHDLDDARAFARWILTLGAHERFDAF